MSYTTIVERIVSLFNITRSECLSLSEVVSKLGLHVSIDELARQLMLSRRVRVYFDVVQDDYVICRRVDNGNGNGNGRVTMQEIVDELRRKFDNEPVPKPMIMDYLKEKIPEKYEAVYMMLLNDGVIEEIDISGMVFVRIVK